MLKPQLLNGAAHQAQQVCSPVRVATLECNEQPAVINLYPRWASGRKRIEDYVADQYGQHHQAQLKEFMPMMLALEDQSGNLLAVAGIRVASAGSLFLEQYMDIPVEHAFAAVMGLTARRDQIVEVGNLAGSQGASRYLIIGLTALFCHWQLHWLAFTGTRQVRNVFNRLGLKPRTVCSADPQRLEEQQHWGTYYENSPQVMVGDIRSGHQSLSQVKAFANVSLNLMESSTHVICA